jgi:hypothetical protein
MMGNEIINNTLKLTNDEGVLSQFYKHLEDLYTLAYEISQPKSQGEEPNYSEFRKKHKVLSKFIADHSSGSTTNPMTRTNLVDRKLASPELWTTLIDIGKPDSANSYSAKTTAENLAILLAPIENNPEDLFKDMDMDFSQLKLEDFHKRVSERLLNQQIKSRFSSIDSSTELEGYLVDVLSDIEKKDQAEMLSPIVSYCDEILQQDIENDKVLPTNDKVFKTTPPKPEEIVSRVSELTFTVTGSGEDATVKKVFVKDGDTWKLNGAGAGIVDSILINPYDEKLIGHSTTVDTSGDIEKDQLYRHPFKVFKINELFKDPKFFKEFPKDVSQITTDPDNESTIIKIQKWDVDETYEEMKKRFDIEENGKIGVDQINEIYKEIDYSFDAFGDLLSPEENPIIKIIKMAGFLEYQESQANKEHFTPEAIKMIRQKIMVKSKGFYGFDEIYQKIEAHEDTSNKLLVLIADAMESAADKDMLRNSISGKSNEFLATEEGVGFKDSIFNRLSDFVNSCKELFQDNEKLPIAPTLSDKNNYINSIVPKLLKYLQTKTRSSHIGALLIRAMTENHISPESHKNVSAGKGLHDQDQITKLKDEREKAQKDEVIAKNNERSVLLVLTDVLEIDKTNNPLFGKKTILGKDVYNLIPGKEIPLIREMFNSIKDSNRSIDELIDNLSDEAEGTPIFYQAYLEEEQESKQKAEAEEAQTKTNKAIDILSKMQDIYKPKTSKGDLLKEFKEALDGSATGSNLPEGLEESNVSIKQVVAEYVISMKFAQDMEEKTVEGILRSEPLSDFFDEDEIKQILTEIDTRPNAPKKNKHASIINFPPKPNTVKP